MQYFRSEIVLYKNNKIGPMLSCRREGKFCSSCYMWDHWIDGIQICLDYLSYDETF